MLLPAIPLDAAMAVSEALVRLAWHGLWNKPEHSAVIGYIEEHRARLARGKQPAPSFEEVARRLHRSPLRIGVAIRRQWYGQILWYALPAEFVLRQLLAGAPGDSVLTALNLHESDGRPPIPVDSAHGAAEGVVVDQGNPVAVCLVTADAPRRRSRTMDNATRGASSRDGGGIILEPVQVQAWPLLDAPQHVEAGTSFTVTVGFASDQQAGVAGGQVVFEAPAGAQTVDLTVELIADGVDAAHGWARPLKVAVADPTTTHATFDLVGRAPAGTEPVHLTMIEARYVLGGAVCGTASRPLEIRAPGYVPPAGVASRGTSWLAQPIATSTVTMEAAAQAADLTIEIFKSASSLEAGSYMCRLYSPHPIADTKPSNVNFGQDSRTFARAVVEEIRAYAADAIVDDLLHSWGEAVADTLPESVYDALREVAEITQPDPPAVLIVSAEPYVPWEIAVLDPPLDPELPPFLGVQTLLGRWLRDGPADPPPVTAGAAAAPPDQSARVRVRKPPAQPPATIQVRHMAVMAGMYNLTSGLGPLPEAEKEAKTLVAEYDAVALSATTESLKQLVEAHLSRGIEEIGGAGAVHFAGHGDFNPANPDASVMLLSDGRPMPSSVFRSANYGGDRQPLIFLNACMLGIGGELLGAMGGFPGNCLKGGFGGVLGALWEINDTVAREFALEFWRRALPLDGAEPEPVAAILRDLRAQYDHKDPVPTYLSYVYYGHPRLTLKRSY